MGLLLSVIVIYVSVIEFLTEYSYLRKSFEPSTSSRDLSPLIRRYEEGLYKERKRIINILDRYKESQNVSTENIQIDKALSECSIKCKQNVESDAPIPSISCNDVCNDFNKNYNDIAASSNLHTFNSTDYWSNSPVIEKTKGKNRTRLKVRSKREKFGKSVDDDELDWSRTHSPMFDVSNYTVDLTNKNLDKINNNNYLTQSEPLKQFNCLNEYLNSGVTPKEDASDIYKKIVSSDKDKNRPFYEPEFLHNLDGMKNKALSKDTIEANAEDSWNPDKFNVSSDESSECGEIILRTMKKSRSFRKTKKSIPPLEVIRHNKVELSSSSECENDLIENVEENAIIEESAKEKDSAENAFWLIFSGEYTKAMNKDWHGQHFCCWQCDESLTGQRYVLRDEHPYCVACYESVFANSCEKCSKIIGIDSKDLSYKDKHWHEACFLCATCSDSLVDKQFGSKGERIYCGRCYDEQFASRCDGCSQIFKAGTKKMEYKTRQWHEKCFCCNVCKVPIGTQSFIPREQEIYCAKCYEEKYATRCIKCNKVITSGGVTYKNEPWHRECFTCTHCNTSLAGARFTSRDDKPYCAECFGELFAKRCTACNKPITGIGGTKFISFEDRHWHNDCFFCASCRTSLVGRGFITDADDIICPDCAKKNLM